ncbi:hypothetical protein Z043_115976 [Scleropages formosus]|uniref:Ig-like domain-containing protein n=1 Tax=Scleropages formosus TaxID=113540 RepID=A0A0P7WVA7_SCLFO|nr:hypothetical protein Z043_115976 [Scleropages formosus]
MGSETLRGFADLRFVLEPSDTTVMRGGLLQLDCQARSVQGAPLVAWRKDGVLLSALVDERRQQLNNGTLLVREVIHSRHHQGDEGGYQCLAWLEGVGAIVSRTAKVTVLGDTTLLRCDVIGEPTPVIRWQKDRRDIVLDPAGRAVALPSGALQFSRVQPSDAAAYRCLAEDPAEARTSTDTVLRVLPESRQPRSLVFLQRPSPVAALEGRDAVFECSASGYPAPSFLWTKAGSAINTRSERFALLGGSNLLIRGVRLEDAGVYRCTALNGHRNISASCELSVLAYPPKPQCQSAGQSYIPSCNTTLRDLRSPKVQTPSQLSPRPQTLGAGRAVPSELHLESRTLSLRSRRPPQKHRLPSGCVSHKIAKENGPLWFGHRQSRAPLPDLHLLLGVLRVNRLPQRAARGLQAPRAALLGSTLLYRTIRYRAVESALTGVPSLRLFASGFPAVGTAPHSLPHLVDTDALDGETVPPAHCESPPSCRVLVRYLATQGAGPSAHRKAPRAGLEPQTYHAPGAPTAVLSGAPWRPGLVARTGASMKGHRDLSSMSNFCRHGNSGPQGAPRCPTPPGEEKIESHQPPPRFLKAPANRYAYESTDVEMECAVTGSPPPTVRWAKNGDMVVPSDYFRILVRTAQRQQQGSKRLRGCADLEESGTTGSARNGRVPPDPTPRCGSYLREHIT